MSLANHFWFSIDRQEIERVRRIHPFWKTSNWETGLKIIGGIALTGTLFLLIYKPFYELKEARLSDEIRQKEDSVKVINTRLEEKKEYLASLEGKLGRFTDSLYNLQTYLTTIRSSLAKVNSEGNSLRIKNRIVLSKLEQGKDSLRTSILDSERKLSDLGSLQQEASDERANATRDRTNNRLDEEFENAKKNSLLRLDSVCLLQINCLRASKKTDEDILKCIEPIFKVYAKPYTDFYSSNKDVYVPIAEAAIDEAKKEFKRYIFRNPKLMNNSKDILFLVKKLLREATQNLEFSDGL